MDYILPSEAIKKLLIESYTSPYSVSYAKNSNDKISGQIAKKQEMFLKLSENIKDKLVSSVTSERIKEIGNFFNLQLQQLADISRVIRGYYFGEIGLEDFPNILAKEIPVDINTAQQISKQIIEKIIKDESLGVNKNLVDLSLSQALKQFPNFGEQAVTSAPIKLKIFPSPVRPSVKNWIEDYRGTMGAEKHGMMERGNYLFHSENGKKLTPGERKKLAEVLRSLDEDVTLSIDPDRQEIIFEESSVIGSSMSSGQQVNDKISNSPNYLISNKIPNSQTPDRPHPSPLPRGEGELSFSSPHTLPSEKSDLVNNESRIMNYGNAGNLRVMQKENNNIEPKIRGNIVDLKN